MRKEYNFDVDSLSPAGRGFFGETWRLEASGNSFFLKLVYFTAHKNAYERSFPIIEHLCNNGIDFISRIVKTADKRLFTRFDGAVLGLFNWIDGKNIENNETKIPEYNMLAKVYAVPHLGVKIPREDFAGKSAAGFFTQWSATTDARINSLLEENRAMLEYRAKRLSHFAGLCRGDDSHFYITHGDAGGNFIVAKDKHYIVDWDDSILAPPERDAWVMGYRGWARRLFQQSLRRTGIDYTLRPERLAYYAYYMFFYWLTWLTGYTQCEDIMDFFNSYGAERIEYADKLYRS
jgi:hypothetical protein